VDTEKAPEKGVKLGPSVDPSLNGPDIMWPNALNRAIQALGQWDGHLFMVESPAGVYCALKGLAAWPLYWPV